MKTRREERTRPGRKRPDWNGIAFRRGGGQCLVRVDARGRIVASSAVSCVWSNTPRFHDWFLDHYEIEYYALSPARFAREN